MNGAFLVGCKGAPRLLPDVRSGEYISKTDAGTFPLGGNGLGGVEHILSLVDAIEDAWGEFLQVNIL